MDEQRFDARPQRVRGHGAGDDPQSGAVLRRQCRTLSTQSRLEGLEVRGLATEADPGGAVRIIEVQQLRLGEHIQGAQTCRMKRITFDLERSPHDVFDDDAEGIAAQHVSSRVEVGQAGHDVGWRAHGRNEVGAEAGLAACHARHHQRSAHQSDGLPPIHAAVEGRRQAGKLLAHAR